MRYEPKMNFFSLTLQTKADVFDIQYFASLPNVFSGIERSSRTLERELRFLIPNHTIFCVPSPLRYMIKQDMHASAKILVSAKKIHNIMSVQSCKNIYTHQFCCRDSEV